MYIQFILMYVHTLNMKTTQIHKEIPQEVQDKIMGDMVFFKDGINQISLGNYALDFKQSYAFLGFTKNKTQVILGQIHTYGEMQQNGKREIKYKKRFAKVELRRSDKVSDGVIVECFKWRMHTDGFRYSEDIMEEVSTKTDISKVAIENTQGLINKDLLLEWGE